MTLGAFIDLPEKPRTILAVDGVTNPQNVGMIIRLAVAAGVDGLLYPKRGIASLGTPRHQSLSGKCFSGAHHPLRCDGRRGDCAKEQGLSSGNTRGLGDNVAV